MKRLRMFGLILPLVLAGCLLTTGQVAIDVDLGTFTATTSTLEIEQVDLNDISDYADHKDDLKGLADLAVLGTVQNNIATAIDVTVWMTKDVTTYTTDVQVRANAIQMWGPFNVPGNATRTIGWDESSALFTAQGKGELINEVKGDGVFTIYVIGAGTVYNFTVTDGTLVLVLDGGI